MNIMNIMKQFRGVRGYRKKKHVFLFLYGVLGLFSCSFCFIMFIFITMRSKNGVCVRSNTQRNIKKMNVM
jgi:hypothetical protein